MPPGCWLIARALALRPEFCGTIQGIRDSAGLGAIQNLGVTPERRGQGLGKALLLRALAGFQQAGLKQAFLEVTAQNLARSVSTSRLGSSTAAPFTKRSKLPIRKLAVYRKRSRERCGQARRRAAGPTDSDSPPGKRRCGRIVWRVPARWPNGRAADAAGGDPSPNFFHLSKNAVTQPIVSHVYENGLVLVAEPMKSLESAAFSFLVPAGCV